MIHSIIEHPIRVVGIFAAFIVLSGCGDIGGAGQCFGVENTGTCLTINSIEPTTDGGPTSDVDAHFSTDCNGDGIDDDPEAGFSHTANITFSNSLLPGVTSPPAPQFVTLTNYSVVYVPNPNNLGSAPDLDGWTFSANNLLLDVGSNFTGEFEMVPIQTKLQYATLGGDTLPQFYTAVYSFTGTSQFNEDIVLQGTVSFAMGDFNNC
ncbi:MAG TPA: hypothetical protein VIU33_08450 [Nitrospiria bacterium]